MVQGFITLLLLLHIDGRNASLEPIYEDFYKILKPILIERVPGTDGNLQVQKYISTFLKQLGWDIIKHSFVEYTPFGDKNFTNLVATFNPTAPKRYTLACHFDSKYFPPSGDKKFIGVTDSAVPCAMLLYLAFLLNDEMKAGRPDASLQLIFFDGEEAFVQWSDTDSLYGSRNLVKFMQKETLAKYGYPGKTLLDAMEIFILLDLIGHCDSIFQNNVQSPSAVDFELLRQIELEICTENKPSFFYQCKNEYFMHTYYQNLHMYLDDHTPFIITGTKIIHMISRQFPSFWHTFDDNETVLCEKTIIDLLRILQRYVQRKIKL